MAGELIRVGDGPPVVWFHGTAGVNAADPAVNAIAAAGFEVIAPKHPGFHELEETDHLLDVHDIALHFDDVLDGLGLDGVPVVGHSYGGMVAAELAAHVPARVSRLVLAAPFGLWRDDEPVADMFSVFPMAINELLWADPSKMVNLAPDADENTDDPMLAMFLGMVKGMTTVAKYLWPIPDKGLRRRLRRIKAPTLLVWGTKDRMIPPSYADDFAALIPDSSIELLDDAGHMAPYEQTDAFVSLVRRLLAS